MDPPLDWHSSPDGTALIPPAMDEPELTTMPLSRAILRLAGPAMTSMILLMVFNLVDIWWVGRLGPDDLAGVSAAAFILWALESVGTLISTGVTALIARYVGARDLDHANRVANQGVILAIISALVFGGCGLVLASTTFTYMGLDGAVFQAANHYMFFINTGLVTIFLTFAIDATFRGTGDTRTPLKIMAMALTLNAVLDPLLMLGPGPFPELRAGGAALATIIAHGSAVVVGWIILQRRPVRIRFPRKPLWDAGLQWKIAKIGAPIAFSGVMFSTSYMFLTRLITPYGADALAALGLGHRIEGIAYFACVGFAVASQTLVGQNLGAQKPERAERAAWLSVLYISLLLIAVSLIYFFFSRTILKIFTDDPRVIQEGMTYLKIIAIFEVFLGFEVVLEGAMGGAGNSVPSMMIIVPLTWARIPIGLLLAGPLGLESTGIWWAISITTGLKGIIMAYWFRRGRWKTHTL
jgi:putative MATE family efflux protein